MLGSLLAAGFIATAAWLGFREIEQSYRAQLAVTLGSVLSSTQQAARTWAMEEKAEALAWAQSPEVLRHSRQLLSGTAGREPLLADGSRRALVRSLEGADHTRGHRGHAVIGRDSVIVSSTRPGEIGSASALAGRTGVLDSIWNGHSVLSVPDKGDTKPGNTEGTVSIAPLRGADGRVIGALALRLDPKHYFSDLFHPGSVAPTARAFAFDRDGFRLSTGHKGAPQAGAHPSAPKWRTPPAAPTALPAGARRLTAEMPEGAQLDLEGYDNAEGRRVIGARVWDETLGFGIAVEMDAADAYASLTLTGRIFTALSVLGMLLVVAVILNQRRFKQLEILLDGIPLGLLIVDQRGVIRRANPSANELFGYSPGRLAGHGLGNLLPEGQSESHEKLRAAYMLQPGPRRMGTGRLVQGRRSNGEVLNLEVALSPVRIAGEPFVLVMAWDIRERLALERELRGRTEDLARSNRDLEQFAYVASHDLRAPLRGIAHLADWIEEELSPQAGSESVHYLNLMRSRVKRMDGLLSSLLEYARASRDENRAEPIHVAKFVEDLAGLLDWPAGFTLAVRGDPPTLLTDGAALQQVLMNVLSNAVKHHDRPQGSVTVSWHDADDAHEFEVADDGPGIPPGMHAKAFEMFQTLRPRDEVEGSGMGLALVKLITERRGGWVAIEANEPRGTKIRIHWPKIETRSPDS
ncbi:MAG: PAS domain S-box protein [Candidatus Eisenbacteria bacterium]|nr:PAS domain S-box protein [Candidatus Eisenbacteria bacterium]